MAFEWISSVFSSAAAKKPEDMTFEEARPAFFKAIKNEDCGTMTAIAQKFPDAITWENGNGTPLYIALAHKKLGSFKHLAELGAALYGESGGLMNIAARDGRKDFVQYMLEQGVTQMDMSEYYARSSSHYEIADMIKRRDIIRAEYLAKNPPVPPPAPPQTPAAPDVTTDSKIDVLSPVQLKKSATAVTA